MVQILEVLVPQKGEELADILKLVDTQTPLEQVIAVPKISNDSIQPRLVECDLRCPQLAEQLVEVLTVLSYALLQQQTAEQITDIPVPRRRRGQGGLQGSHPGQSSAARVVEQIVDIPVREGFQGSKARQSSFAAYCGAAH